jgi:hypothetical protein
MEGGFGFVLRGAVGGGRWDRGWRGGKRNGREGGGEERRKRGRGMEFGVVLCFVVVADSRKKNKRLGIIHGHLHPNER